MTLQHIDNNFFRLTAHQAKELSLEGRLPREGFEVKADPAKLVQVRTDPGNHRISAQATGWIKRTRLSWHRGEAIAKGWVWAVHIHHHGDIQQ